MKIANVKDLDVIQFKTIAYKTASLFPYLSFSASLKKLNQYISERSQEVSMATETNKEQSKHAEDAADPILMKNIDELTGGRSNLRIFVPLCGKTRDMLWLADQGHSVVGVELATRYIKGFFRDSNLEYTVSSEQIAVEKNANVYAAKGKNIKVYQCDIFDFSREVSGGPFDGIWDQSAMPVINEMGEKKLQQYASLMQSLLLPPDGRHMVEVCKHGKNFVTGEKLKSLYGEKCDVRYIGTRLWKYEESDDEWEGEEGHDDHGTHEHEGHDHGSREHEGHDHGDHEHDDDDEVEMFYHVITFK